MLKIFIKIVTDKLTSINKAWYIVLLLTIMLMISSISRINHNNGYDKTQEHINSLTERIKILEFKQVEKDSIITMYETRIAMLDTQIKTEREKLNNFKRKHYNDKIKSINTFTPSELDSFFTNRYK